MADDVVFSGPLFDGRAPAIVGRYVTDLTQTVADRGVDLVEERLHDAIRHPTGYYESHIRTERQSDGIAVTDGGVVYGPWLEGTGSRNSPKTRFPGYASFRRAAAQLENETSEIGERVLVPYLTELNGD